jgi:hypothetical protein
MPFSPPSRLWPLVLVALAGCGGTPEPRSAGADSLRQAAPPVAAARESASAAPVAAEPVGQEIRSVRTTLKSDDCTTVSVDEEAGGSTQRCPGTAGYTLLALDGDARMSITVVAPDGTERPLEFWTTITGGFTSLGDEAEWRVRGAGAAAVPVALIVPLRANEHPDDPERLTPYRVIAKVTPTEACVTHRLPGATPDAEVRRLADASAGAPCRTSYDEPE